MALTVAQLAVALRLGNPPATEESAIATRLLSYATTAVQEHAPGAPESVKDEAVIRIAAYLFDQPNAGMGARYSNALVNSGAGSILLPYREHRAGSTDPDGSAAASGLTPSGETGGPAVDQTARDAAAAAQRTADLAESTATDALAKGNEAIGDVGDLLPLVAAAANPAAATNAEADTPTGTGLRSWSAALIARVVRAVVPSWARRAAEPEGGRFRFVPEASVTQSNRNVFSFAGVTALPAIGHGFAFFVKQALVAGHNPTISVGDGSLYIIHRGDGSTFANAVTELPRGSYVEAVWAGSTRNFEALTHVPASASAATEDAAGVVTLARAEDVADSETDLTRVPNVTRAIALIRRLIGENVRSIPEAEASHVGYPLIAVASRPGADGGWRKLTGAGVADNTIAESNLTAELRTKLNARGGGTTDQTARDAAAAAQLEADTVIEISPPFTVGETAARNINVDLRHPLNAYSQANVLSVSVQGRTPVLVEYNPRVMNQTLALEIPATTFSNIAARLVAGGFIDVEIRLTAGRNGPVHFIRVVSVPVVAAPTVARPHWYEMARAFNTAIVAGTAYSMELRGDGKGVFANAAAVRSAVGDGSISMLAVQRSDSDAQTFAANAPNFLSSVERDYATEFVFPSGEAAVVRFTSSGITVTPDFSKTSVVRFDLGVFA